MSDGERLRLQVGPLTFDASAAGPLDGPLTLLLHGFPQSGATWRSVQRSLADAGRRAVAPDLRGYSPDARPVGVEEYALDALVADVLGLADALGAERFDVVGHDWGGALAWALAADHPERVATVTVVSTPHPAALLEAVPRSLQALRSAYVPFFQVPALPEAILAARNGALLQRVLRLSGCPGQAAGTYAARMAAPGALTAALSWYRAARPARLAAIGPARVPTTFIWSDGDVALGGTAARRTEHHIEGDYRFEVLAGASHWLPETRPDDVARLALLRMAP